MVVEHPILGEATLNVWVTFFCDFGDRENDGGTELWVNHNSNVLIFWRCMLGFHVFPHRVSCFPLVHVLYVLLLIVSVTINLDVLVTS